jgi:multidrug resistance protein
MKRVLEPESIVGNRHILWAMMTQVFLIMLGIGLVGPITPLYAKSFGVSATSVGGLITAFGLAPILANIPAGGLAETLGRRPLLVGGPLIVSLAALLTALATQFPQLIAFRFLQGLGSAAQTTAAMTVMADISTREARGRAMSRYQGALLLGTSVGPAIGGLIAAQYGYRAPFVVYAVLAATAAVWSFFALPETRGASRAASAAARGTQPALGQREVISTLLRDRNFVLVSLVTLSVFFTRTGSRSTVLPLFGNVRLGLSAGQLGYTFTLISLVNFATINLCGALCDRYGRKIVIVPSAVLSGLPLVLFSLSGNYLFFLLSGAVMGLAFGLFAKETLVREPTRPVRQNKAVRT